LFLINSRASEIRFIGQHGKILKTIQDSDRGWIRFLSSDTYIRTEISFSYQSRQNAMIYYLNPVFRYNGMKPVNGLKAVINWPRTWVSGSSGFPS